MNQIAVFASGGLALLLFILYVRERALRSRLEARIQQPQEGLSRPETWEARIDRLDVLWFPIVTYSSAAKKVTKTAPGVPYCKNCVEPLSLSKGNGGGWMCPQCKAAFPESLADVSIGDMVTKQALKQFLERRKDYRAP